MRTDHAALTWLQRTLNMIGQQARGQDRLQGFSFTIQHRPGTKHGNADALSKRPCHRADCCLPAEDIDESETAPPSLSRADARTVDGDEATVSAETTADDDDQGRHQNRPTGSGSPLTTEAEPWPPLEAKWIERLSHQEGQLSRETERIARFQRRERSASAPRNGQLKASGAVTDAGATGSGVLPTWKAGSSGTAREATGVATVASDRLLSGRSDVGNRQHSATGVGVNRLSGQQFVNSGPTEAHRGDDEGDATGARWLVELATRDTTGATSFVVSPVSRCTIELRSASRPEALSFSSLRRDAAATGARPARDGHGPLLAGSEGEQAGEVLPARGAGLVNSSFDRGPDGGCINQGLMRLGTDRLRTSGYGGRVAA